LNLTPLSKPSPRRPAVFAVACLILASAITPCVAGGQDRQKQSDSRPSASWIVTTVAGTGEPENNGRQGQATEINIGYPFGVEIGPDGDLYVTEVWNHRVWQLKLQTNQLRVVAGNGTQGYAGDGGPAAAAALNEPYEIRFDRRGNLYFVEMRNHLVRRVDAQTGIISTIAGTGEPGFSGDGGPATQAQLRLPHAIVIEPTGGLLIADIGNHRVRRVDLETGIIDTIVGNGETSFPTDGAVARGSPLPGPRALAVTDNDLWIVLREGHALWRLEFPNGTVHHVAGTGRAGYSGDQGPARDATFHGPKGLVADREGNLLVVDSENDSIRHINVRTGIVTTLAGRGRAQTFGGDGGPANQAEFAQPHGICVGPDGSIYVGDTLNHRVRRIGKVGVIGDASTEQ
jgi:sugar lactone lactonase YvrE